MIILVPHQSTVRPELRFQFTHGEGGIHKLLDNRSRIAHTDQINNDPAHRQLERNNQQEVHIAKYFILIEKHHNRYSQTTEQSGKSTISIHTLIKHT